jgi:hypothetical protein
LFEQVTRNEARRQNALERDVHKLERATGNAEAKALSILNSSRKAKGLAPLSELPFAGPAQSQQQASALEICNAGRKARNEPPVLASIEEPDDVTHDLDDDDPAHEKKPKDPRKRHWERNPVTDELTWVEDADEDESCNDDEKRARALGVVLGPNKLANQIVIAGLKRRGKL